MKSIIRIFYFILVLSTLSCKKYNYGLFSTRVSGRVIDYYSGVPVTNAKIVLYKDYEAGIPAHPIDSFYTDVIGNFSFKFSGDGKKESVHYYAGISKSPWYFSTNRDENTITFNMKRKNKLGDVKIKGISRLRLRLVNQSPSNATDHIEILGHTIIGADIDSIFEIDLPPKNDGSINYKICFNLYENGPNIGDCFLVDCPSLQTTDYTLYY